MPMHTGRRDCRCIQCNMRRKGVTPGRRRRRRNADDVASRFVAEEMRAMHAGSSHVRTPRQAVAVGMSRARATGTRDRHGSRSRRANPSVTVIRKNPAIPHDRYRQGPVLSTRAISLAYVHAEGRKEKYEHKFARGVTIQLLSDGTVRLYRPDGKPLWKRFKEDRR